MLTDQVSRLSIPSCAPRQVDWFTCFRNSFRAGSFNLDMLQGLWNALISQNVTKVQISTQKRKNTKWKSQITILGIAQAGASKCYQVTALCYLSFFFFGLRSILWGYWLPLFWTSCDPLHGFQSQADSLPSTLLLACQEPKGQIWCYISLFTVGLFSRHCSCKQWREGNGGKQ